MNCGEEIRKRLDEIIELLKPKDGPEKPKKVDVNVTSTYKSMIGDECHELPLLMNERFKYLERGHEGPCLVILGKRNP